jgi:hypothetical protein
MTDNGCKFMAKLTQLILMTFLPFTTFTDVKKGSRYEEIAFIRDC